MQENAVAQVPRIEALSQEAQLAFNSAVNAALARMTEFNRLSGGGKMSVDMDAFQQSFVWQQSERTEKAFAEKANVDLATASRMIYERAMQLRESK